MTKIQNSKFNILSSQKGALLLELLVVISLLAIILSVGSQAMLVSMQSGKVSGERDVATALASEGLEAVRGVTEEKWHNIYNKTKGTQHYYATSTNPAGKWSLATTTIASDEQVVMNGITFTRYIIIENVQRDSTSRNIVTSGGIDDPSTQKVTVTVSWLNADPVTISDYFFRWRNKVCVQTSWLTTVASTTVQTCPTTTYDTKDASMATTSGLHLI